jgi:FtsP/CotA-like multicopper oxidase with cupredoxin domain
MAGSFRRSQRLAAVLEITWDRYCHVLEHEDAGMMRNFLVS